MNGNITYIQLCLQARFVRCDKLLASTVTIITINVRVEFLFVIISARLIQYIIVTQMFMKYRIKVL